MTYASIEERIQARQQYGKHVMMVEEALKFMDRLDMIHDIDELIRISKEWANRIIDVPDDPSTQELWLIRYGDVIKDMSGFSWNTWGAAFGYGCNSFIRNIGKRCDVLHNEIIPLTE